MKLYTEEQVIKAIELAKYCEYDCGGVYFDFNLDSILLKLTHIEIPSDEEISEEVKFYDERWEIRQAIEFGAKLICDKIQGNHIGDANEMVGDEQ